MRSTFTRHRGSALFITLIICAGFAALAIAAVDRMVGLRQITTVDLAKQRAAAAAEAISSMIESKLMDAAADYTKLTIPVEKDSNPATNPWWKLNGCVYKDASGNMHGPGFDPGSKAMWVNGCLVRWMVEPVRVYSKVWSSEPSAVDYVVNPPSDPSQMKTWEQDAKIGPNQQAVPGTLNKKISDFYHFRVVAQAYALKDAENTSAQPWSTPGAHIAASQSLRILQIQSLQLFKYALFYCANAPIGDLDLQTGGTIWVQKGAVHSNGAIYIRGGESNGFYNQNWHWMASGDGDVDAVNAGQSIFLGEAERPITITGVAGIFRMGKTGNHLAAQHKLEFNTGLFNPQIPLSVPTDTAPGSASYVKDDITVGGSRLDLNGDWTNSTRHRFNGVNFTRANDSRTESAFVSDFKNYARDSRNGGTTVRTLQNIPEMGGRPFEPQSLVFTVTGVPNPLYGTGGVGGGIISRNPGALLSPLYYAPPFPTDPAGSVSRARLQGTAVNTVIVPNGHPILAEEMRLWWNAAMTAKDVLAPATELPLLDQIPSQWGPANNERERPATYVCNPVTGVISNVLQAPTYVDLAGLPIDPIISPGVLSFPGVPFFYGGKVWQPGFFGCGFSPREVKGFYLEAALFGDLPVGGTLTKQQQYYQNTTNVPVDINRTGIVIRERRWQQRPMLGAMQPILGNLLGNEIVTAWNYYWPGDWLKIPLTSSATFLNIPDPLNPFGATNVLAIPRPTLGLAPTLTEKIDYVNYLCSQYSVLFCGRNITAPFFGQILSQTNPRDFIVTEDEFVDPRESGYMWGMYGAKGDTTGMPAVGVDAFYQRGFFPSGSGSTTREYRQNVLTIHMKGFQDWLRATPMSILGYSGDTTTASAHFSGVLYNHRTRRSDTMHPLLTPELDWPGMNRILNNVESDPQRLVDQTHFRAYWFTECDNSGFPTHPFLKPQGTGNASALPIIYPPINFPWNWREPAGPLETTRCATRIKGQLNTDAAEVADPNYYRVYWNHSSPTSTGDALGTSAFTYISPQRFYMWGHFCYKLKYIDDEAKGRAEIDANLPSITPCAIFADNYTIQSAGWLDSSSQSLPVHGNGKGYPTEQAQSTCQFVSMVINNSPNSAWNCASFGSAGQEGTFRMMENWGYGATNVWWSGSQVVMNMGRYHHSGHNFVDYKIADGRTGAPAHMGIGAFEASTNHYIFNTNLFSREGRPPLSPSGVTATRVVNQISNFGE